MFSQSDIGTKHNELSEFSTDTWSLVSADWIVRLRLDTQQSGSHGPTFSPETRAVRKHY